MTETTRIFIKEMVHMFFQYVTVAFMCCLSVVVLWPLRQYLPEEWHMILTLLVALTAAHIFLKRRGDI